MSEARYLRGNGRRWRWPLKDERLMGCFRQSDNVAAIVGLVPADRRAVCVQAGGAVGVWPLLFAQHFAQVLTFEPMPENYECLVENIGVPEGRNIVARNAALWDTGDLLQYVMGIANNYGAGRCEPGNGDVWAMTIDSLELDACDLIQLDVEGGEYRALRGAHDTLATYKPVVCIEHKPLRHAPLCPHVLPYLKALGYKPVAEIQRDVILRAH
jgi:FkbM family methyltransferase